MEITVLNKFVELYTWYDRQGYELGGQVPFPASELAEGYDVKMQLMTKHVA